VTNNGLSPIRLLGIDGRNLLGFLSAIGAFDVIADEQHDARMSWDDAWHPVLYLPGSAEETDEETVVDLLWSSLQRRRDLNRFPWPNLTVLPEVFRAYAQGAADRVAVERSSSSRIWADFVCGLGSESVERTGTIADTALRTMSGAGHQDFLRTMNELQEKTTRDHLRSALFAPWRYEDPKLSLRWDPIDDRRYALRATDPAKSSKDNTIPSVWGANRLAFEALGCFPTMPVARGLATTGTLEKARSAVFHWPIWEPAVSAQTMRSLLAHRAVLAVGDADSARISRRQSPHAELQGLGVRAVLRSHRITNGKYRNFTPAEVIPIAGIP
jgi:hypothetical protein